MPDDNSKYSRNRNLWRKLYPVGAPRRAPQVVEFVDGETQLTYSLNLQTTIRHRDYFKIQNYQSGAFVIAPTGSTPTGSGDLGEYDEGLIHFQNESEKLFNFNFTFSNAPIVVLTMEDSASAGPADTTNVNIFGFNKSTTGSFVGLSAPFSGTVRYRAAYAATYPAAFTSSFTASFSASAGTFTPTNESAYTASYAALAGVPSVFLQTPFDPNSTFTADVSLQLQTASLSSTNADSEISAPVSTPIDFIAYE